MLTIDALKEYGANVEEGLSRCFGDESFYFTLMGMLVQEQNFANLESALAANDLDKAFEAAHALKGVCCNLAVTPIYKPVEEITELLRSRTQMDYDPLLQEILKQKKILEELIG